MEKMTLAETIKDITRSHLENSDGLLFGECVSAVGWINGTVPDCKNIIELPMTDVAGADFAVGAALMGKRPIFVMRFQGFFLLNCNAIINYAAISKELHGVSCPIFIRSLGIDGELPSHSSVMHSVAMHFPGMRVAAPMTPSEYREVWNDFMNHDDPIYVSEHRSAYQNVDDMNDELVDNADITLYGIADARPNMLQAAMKLRNDGYKVNVVHIVSLKPFDTDSMAKHLTASRKGLVIDNSFAICGAARSIAYELAEKAGCFIAALSCTDHIKGINPLGANKTPNCDVIYRKAIEILNQP